MQFQTLLLLTFIFPVTDVLCCENYISGIKNMSDNVFGNPFGDVSYISSNPSRVGQTTALSSFSAELIDAATMTIQALNEDELPTELDAKRKALLVEVEESATDTKDPSSEPDGFEMDTIFSFRAEFGGFLE